MVWIFRKSFKIAPGLRVNVGKKSASLRVGPRGAGVTVGTEGARASAGLPGTGLYVSQKIGKRAAKAEAREPEQLEFEQLDFEQLEPESKAANKATRAPKRRHRWLIVLAVIVVTLFWAFMGAVAVVLFRHITGL